jgi:hypothetical protein
MADARTYAEQVLLNEIERALRSDDGYLLRVLDRIREASGLPVDGRVIDRLHRKPDIKMERTDDAA